ncbi:MAG: hypothetical protein KKF98_14105 [Bacteroidetes bacterium]|nr:hypothetical protein [Bacteroidota bacterium]
MKITRAINGIVVDELFKSNPNIDFVLMDIKMPEMDGYGGHKTDKSNYA